MGRIMTDILLIIIEQVLLYLPAILGAYVSISLLKVPDLSIESAYVCGAIGATIFLSCTQGLHPMALLTGVLFAATGCGMLIGLSVTALTRIAKFPHLLASIAMIGLMHGLGQYILGSAQRSLTSYSNPLVLIPILTRSPELPLLAIAGIVVSMGMFMLMRSQLGYCLAAHGNNPRFLESHGISTSYVCAAGLAISNGLAGLSGYLVAQSSGFVDINAGHGISLFAITALILGKIITHYTHKARITAAIAIFGLIAYCTMQQLLLKVGFNLTYFTAVQAGIVIIILAYSQRNKEHTATDTLGV